MQVELFKKKGKYVDKDGNEKVFIRFYVKCNDTLVPVEPTYFNKKDDNGNELKDFQYSGRKSILESFANDLPEKESN